MSILLVRIQPRRRSLSPAQAIFSDFVQRCSRYSPVETQDFATESAFLNAMAHESGRTAPVLILTDASGLDLSSPEFARRLGDFADRGVQKIVLAVGPPDGWSAQARSRAALLVAFGRITLPHELAAIVLAEQTYRALTIRAGHPYHSGH